MTLTVPSEIETARPFTEAIPGSEIAVHRDDLKRVRLYCRLAGAVSALSVVLSALVIHWLSIRLFGRRWDPVHSLIAMTVILIVGVVIFLRAESRSRSYGLELTADAVIFEYGRRRSYVPWQHIQLFDSETSMLLRVFRLRRCSLHTGGGTVIVSPVPAHLAFRIERLVHDQLASMPADRTDAER